MQAAAAWALFALALLGATLLVEAARRVLVGRFERGRPLLRAALSETDARLSGLAQAGRYLSTKARDEMRGRLAHAASRAFPPLLDLAARATGGDVLRRVAEARRALAQARLRVEGHNDAHVREELARHHALLVGEERLSEEQRVAAVRDDDRNLVVAAAGSGKTRVLRARVRYLLARRDRVEPGRILVVAYTRDAAEELRTRLAVADVEGVQVSTMHALGNAILGRHRGAKPKALDADALDGLVRRMMQEADAGKDEVFAERVRDALANFHRHEMEDAPVEKATRHRTLRGEIVKSLGERRIADFLLLHGVPYAYEAPARWAPRAPDKRQYAPDFHLTREDLHLEHWGLDARGDVAPWVEGGAEAYRARMAWARAAFAEKGRRLVETYFHESRRADFEHLLAQRLRKEGVALRRLTLEELKREVPSLSAVQERMHKSLVAFVTNARALRVRAADVPPRLAPYAPRVRAFGACAAHVLRRFEEEMETQEATDFAGMIHDAADLLESGQVPEGFRFDHVLVDEFQDLSRDRARLAKALLKAGGGKLFAVGDDWQAIYAFSGGDVRHILDFEREFGPATISRLTLNHRCPEAVVRAGAVLIEANARRVHKEVRASKPTRFHPLVHLVADDEEKAWARAAEVAAEEWRALASEGGAERVEGARVLVLSRFRKPLKDIEARLRRMRVPVGDGGVALMTAHSAKGTEAHAVVLVDASEDLYGFPSQVEDLDLLHPVRMAAEDPEAEERRLFYVALTRATERLHVIAREGRESRFLREIQGDGPAPEPARATDLREGERAEGVARVVALWPLTDRQRAAGIRQVGLVQWGQERVRFTTWRGAPDLELGAAYRLEGAQVGLWQGRPQLKLKEDARIILLQDAKAHEEAPAKTMPLRIRAARR